MLNITEKYLQEHTEKRDGIVHINLGSGGERKAEDVVQVDHMPTIANFIREHPLCKDKPVHLNLSSQPCLRSKHTYEALKGLPNLKGLFLVISGAGEHTDAITKITSLESLDLYATRIDDDTLNKLAAMSNLKKLSIGGERDKASIEKVQWLQDHDIEILDLNFRLQNPASMQPDVTHSSNVGQTRAHGQG
jgi:hypothetical protein